LKNQVALLSKGQGTGISLTNGLLLQNNPNPVRRSTSIVYSLPPGTSHGQLLLMDNLGRTIKTVTLNASGSLNFDASLLRSGLYTYSLIADGQIVDTKKMTVVKD